MSRKQLEQIATLIVIAVLGYLLNLGYRHYFPSHPLETDSPQSSTEALFASSLADSSGKSQPVAQWQGKVLVVNFWATWCPPCREEMPELSRLHEKYNHRNVAVIGIALDDREKVQAFSAESPVNYPLLVGDIEAMNLASTLGNSQGALPYTVIVRTDGRIEKTFLGRVNLPILEKTLTPILLMP